MKKYLLALLFFFSFAAGAVDFGKPASQSSQDWHDVIAIAQKINHQEAQIFCSGVVIHPRVVLSAAHCFQEEGGRRPPEYYQNKASQTVIYFGYGKDGGKVREDLLPVKNIYVHHRYLRDIRGQADIAVLTFDEDLPIELQQIRPIALDIDLVKLRIRRGVDLTVVGYGYSEQLQGSFGREEFFGIKHYGTVLMRGKTADEIQAVAGPAVDRFGLYRMGPREGDSGGPVYFEDSDGTTYLTGIVSRAARHNFGGHGSTFSLVRNQICWIERVSGYNIRPVQDDFDYCQQKLVRYSHKDLAQLDFLSLCERQRPVSDAQAYTIDVLFRLLNENSCDSLRERLLLTTNLNLDATHIIDLSPLSEFTNFERLSLRDNAIQWVRPLENMSRLRFLDLSYNNVRDFSFLAPLIESNNLWLIGSERQYHNITRTNFIRYCHGEGVSAEAQKTMNAIFALFSMSSTRCIDANYELLRLRSLRLFSTSGLSDMSPLEGLNTLEELDLSGQKVSDLNFLYRLGPLRKLVLDSNPIDDLTPLIHHRNLRHLSLRHHTLSADDVMLLAQLPRLQVLDLTGASYDDLSPLERRIGIGALKVIDEY